jgi:hypothetical protein
VKANPSLEERIMVWKLTYARNCLLQCKEFLTELETGKSLSKVAIRALSTAAIVTYGQPFTPWYFNQNSRIIPLEKVSPPKNYEASHDELIELRHKVIAHIDGSDGDFIKSNDVHLLKDSSGFSLPPRQLARFPSRLSNDAKELCDFYVRHCDREVDILIQKYRGILSDLEVGTYKLVLDPSADWLKPLYLTAPVTGGLLDR